MGPLQCEDILELVVHGAGEQEIVAAYASRGSLSVHSELEESSAI